MFNDIDEIRVGLDTTSSTEEEIKSTKDKIIAKWKELNGNTVKDSSFSIAGGIRSHVEGCNCLALAPNSHAEGYCSQALMNQSHSEGNQTISEGKSSHAEGFKTWAAGEYSHTEGMNTTSGGIGSHCGGHAKESYS